MENKNLQIAILDMNDKRANKGLSCIEKITKNFLVDHGGRYEIFEVRQDLEFPSVEAFDIFISSGGPGEPIPCGEQWEKPYFELLDQIEEHNRLEADKKHLFLICHSFQLACYHWKLARIMKCKNYLFGIIPIHKTRKGQAEVLFKNLPDPFYAVESRAYQVVQPNSDHMKDMGAKILCMDYCPQGGELERSILSIRFTPEIFGTQFHPEAEAKTMNTYFSTFDQKKKIINKYGEEKYIEIMYHLKDEEKIALTEKEILPTFLKLAAKQIFSQTILM